MNEKIRKIWKKYSHSWVFLYTLVYVSWYLYLERTVVRSYNLIHCKLDDLIPFNEYFVIPYFYWFIYMIVGCLFFFFKDRDEFYRYAFFITIGMSTCLLICQIYPNGTNLRPALDIEKNWATKMVGFIYRVDTDTNVFPSIHVYNSIGTHIAIMKSKYFQHHFRVRLFSGFSCIIISLSTVFLKQHSVLDGLAAFLLAAIMYALIYGGVSETEESTEKGREPAV
ncbi:MAG: phosphoesterase [Johnsonella sp.]|nr:phosphoesterase [Johnsonella sp.]